MTVTPGRHLALFGAPLDTGNLGVSALGTSTIAAVATRCLDDLVTVFDNGRGRRTSQLQIGETTVRIEQRGAWISRRLYRPESLWTMDAASRLRPPLLPALGAIDRSELVLDVSGGDSFTDLYGPLRLQLIALPKRIALRRGRPLVLLPQTYGPFRDPESARLAGDLIAGAHQAWARDEESFTILRDLLGDRFDEHKHRCGVDIAFALPATDPGTKLGDVRDWLTDDEPVVGLNVSGLLHHDAQAATERFGLRLDYRETIRGVIERFVRDTDLRVVLVDHTHGATESDRVACEALASAIGQPSRVRALPHPLDATQVKWVISRFAWFCGTRMHSTIAALSSLVPTVAIAYSDKYAGVFATCGVADEVLDARRVSTTDAIDRIWGSWEQRAATSTTLRARVPGVVEQAHHQFDALLATQRTDQP